MTTFILLTNLQLGHSLEGQVVSSSTWCQLGQLEGWGLGSPRGSIMHLSAGWSPSWTVGQNPSPCLLWVVWASLQHCGWAPRASFLGENEADRNHFTSDNIASEVLQPYFHCFCPGERIDFSSWLWKRMWDQKYGRGHFGKINMPQSVRNLLFCYLLNTPSS